MERLRKTVMIVGVPVEIQKKSLPKTGLGPYRQTNLLAISYN
jgi:hypothetical protein